MPISFRWIRANEARSSKVKLKIIWPSTLLLSAVALVSVASGQVLQVRFGARGLEQLTYKGQVVEDMERWPSDEAHIWHMKCFAWNGKDLGKVLTAGQYGWGETNQGRAWDPASNTWTYTFSWGTIRIAYIPHADSLDIKVTEQNRVGSGIVLDGASIYPLELHLPGVQPGTTAIADGLQSPGVTLLDWSGGKVAAVVPDADHPLFSGFQPGKDGALEVLVSSTRPDALSPAPATLGRSVRPGRTETFTLSLRFADSTAKPTELAADAYANWARRWPQTLHWTDRRVIGSVFLASSPQGDKTRPAGFPANPRRYFSDAGVDVSSPAGLARFQARVLTQAREVAANLKRLDAQGAITWDIEGEEYPQDTSYLCAPDQIARLAPEMETVVGAGQPYAGMKLDDAYFKTIRDAGFRVGVCVRPQRLALDVGGAARQQSLPEADVAAELSRKMRYAHDRWGATIFYLDSTVRADGSTLDPSVIEAAAAALPDSLVIPEESTPRMYRATAPFLTFLFHGDLATDQAIRAYEPAAFSVNLVNDVDPAKLALHHRELVEAVRRGDILIALAGYWQSNNPAIVRIYREAGVK